MPFFHILLSTVKQTFFCKKPSLWILQNSKDKTECVTINRSARIFFQVLRKLKQECTFRGKPHLLLLNGETETTQNATVACLNAPFQSFEVVVLMFAHLIFIWDIFQTPERRMESEITTEEHATSCELLSLTCCVGTKQTKVCSEAFPGEPVLRVLVLSYWFLCRPAAFIFNTILRQSFFVCIWSYLGCSVATGRDAITTNTHTHTQAHYVSSYTNQRLTQQSIFFLRALKDNQ